MKPRVYSKRAIYAFTKELLDYIEEQGNEAEDFSTGVLPQLLDRIYTVHTEDNYLDIGKFENLVNARIWRTTQLEIVLMVE